VCQNVHDVWQTPVLLILESGCRDKCIIIKLSCPCA